MRRWLGGILATALLPGAAAAALVSTARIRAYGCADQTTATPKINTVEHGAFQDSLNSYLQGTPDDVNEKIRS